MQLSSLLTAYNFRHHFEWVKALIEGVSCWHYILEFFGIDAAGCLRANDKDILMELFATIKFSQRKGKQIKNLSRPPSGVMGVNAIG